MLMVDGRIAFTGGINISEFMPVELAVAEESGGSTNIGATPISELKARGSGGPGHSSANGIPERPGSSAQPNYFRHLERQGIEIVRVIASVPERFSLIYVTFDLGDSQFPDQRIYHRCRFRAGPSNVAGAGARRPARCRCAMLLLSQAM